MGLFGASFGINRDKFRGVFDKTDLLFKGIFNRQSSEAYVPTLAEERQACIKKSQAMAREPEFATAVMYQGDEKQSATCFRDKIAADRAAMLLSFDPRGAPH